MSAKKILILAANPQEAKRLRLDQEVREIEAGLERSQQRHTFEIVSKWAVRVQDLRRSLLDHQPQIVHFSGHGAGAQGLVLEDEIGQARLVSAEALAGLFRLFNIECVLLNACYSEVQAKAIAQHVDFVIGMNQALGDQAAIAFAVGFYDALGAGRSYEEAYEFGCSAIDFERIDERSTPVLMKREKPERPQPIILETPEGQVPLGSPFYVDRPPNESDCYAEIVKPGALIRVKAARQMGKTSLMTRILNQAEQKGGRSVPIYFQEADGEVFTSLDGFLQWFCSTVTEELGLPDQLETFWQRGAIGNKRKCGNYFQQYILSKLEQPLVLGLDEVDLIFQHLNIARDFFSLLRAWHERGKNESTWQKLKLVIVHSREVYIPLNMHESPFNVGVPIELAEFTKAQVQDLATRHGLNLSLKDIEQLMVMVGGHPYLVRVALYEIARRRSTLTEFLAIAPTEEGPYADHLRRHLLNLRENANLVSAIKQAIAANTPIQVGSDEAFKLRSMGLVKFQGNAVIPLCDLYRQYFRNRLDQ